jgi:hypothetical protein
MKLTLLLVIVANDAADHKSDPLVKGTVQRLLSGVLSGINRKHMIWAWAT